MGSGRLPGALLPALLSALFSDRWRVPRMVLLAVLLVGLAALYGYRTTHITYGYELYIEDPARWDGHSLSLSLWFVDGVQPEGYRLRQRNRVVPVEGDPTGLAPGDTVSVQGRFRAEDGAVVEQWRQVHRLRAHKWLLSLVGLLFAVAYGAWHLRIRGGRLVLRG